MRLPLSSKIEMHSIELTKSERKIAEFISNNQQLVSYCNINKLSSLVDVGEATIVRFCRKLDFDGYLDFRSYLHDELLDQQALHTPSQQKLSTDSSFIDIANKLHELNSSSISDTLALLDERTINQIIGYLKSAKNIYFYGLGLSGLIALEGKYKWMRIGMRVDACIDEHMLLVNSSLVTKDDLIFAVSNSGESATIIQAVRQASENGAKVVSITKYPKAAINKYVNAILLNCGLDSGLEIGSSTIKTSQVFLIDMIYNAYLFDRMGEGNELNWLKATKQAFERPKTSHFNATQEGMTS